MEMIALWVQVVRLLSLLTVLTGVQALPWRRLVKAGGEGELSRCNPLMRKGQDGLYSQTSKIIQLTGQKALGLNGD